MMMLGYAFSWVFAYIGMVSSTPEAANAIGFMTIFPLTFISSAFVPVESMPAALQAFAEVNPFTTVVDAMRHLWQGAPANTDVWVAFLETIVHHGRVLLHLDGEVQARDREVAESSAA